jgi:hypothetical protein
MVLVFHIGNEMCWNEQVAIFFSTDNCFTNSWSLTKCQLIRQHKRRYSYVQHPYESLFNEILKLYKTFLRNKFSSRNIICHKVLQENCVLFVRLLLEVAVCFLLHFKTKRSLLVQTVHLWCGVELHQMWTKVQHNWENVKVIVYIPVTFNALRLEG